MPPANKRVADKREQRNQHREDACRPPGRQHRRNQADDERHRQHERNPDPARFGLHEPVRQKIVGDRRVNLNARHHAARERRLEHVEQARRGHADEHDLVAKHRRIDIRLLVRQQLLF